MFELSWGSRPDSKLGLFWEDFSMEEGVLVS